MSVIFLGRNVLMFECLSVAEKYDMTVSWEIFL